jgi:hypothetical protein
MYEWRKVGRIVWCTGRASGTSIFGLFVRDGVAAPHDGAGQPGLSANV